MARSINYACLLWIVSCRIIIFTKVLGTQFTDFGYDNLWPRGKIPFYIDPQRFQNNEYETIFNAMRFFERETCIQFQQLPWDKPRSQHHILFTNGSACSSLIGRRNSVNETFQTVTLPEWCMHPYNIAHELLHVVGFAHEHCRPDRNKFIRINWENINQRWMGAFKFIDDAHKLLGFRVPYDYHSILHYDGRDFRDSTRTGATMESVHPEFPIHTNFDLSKLDILKVNLLYNCVDDLKRYEVECEDFFDECPNIDKERCLADSYMQRVCRKHCNRCHFPILR